MADPSLSNTSNNIADNHDGDMDNDDDSFDEDEGSLEYVYGYIIPYS
jgi:hypothetical protein